MTTTVTLLIADADAIRIAKNIGVVKSLVDTQVPPQPRSATLAESKQYIIDRLTQLCVDVEGAAAQRIAVATIVIPPITVN